MALLVWSNGTEIYHHFFEDSDDMTGVERAREQMYKEYENHGPADEDCGAFKGEDSCYFVAEGFDSCIWTVIPVPLKK